MTQKLPKIIKATATRTFTYDVEEARNSIRDINNDPELVVSDDEVLDLIYEWAYEDFQSPMEKPEYTLTGDDGQQVWNL